DESRRCRGGSRGSEQGKEELRALASPQRRTTAFRGAVVAEVVTRGRKGERPELTRPGPHRAKGRRAAPSDVFPPQRRRRGPPVRLRTEIWRQAHRCAFLSLKTTWRPLPTW